MVAHDWRGAIIKQLKTIVEFRDAVRRGVPIVITDKTTGNRFHPSAQGCDHVIEDHFMTKVVINGGKNGGYFEVSDINAARERWPGLSGCWV